MISIKIKKWVLQFKRPAGTSRGVLFDKPVWYVMIRDKEQFGIGECNPLKGLSLDDIPDFEERLTEFANIFEKNQCIDFDLLEKYPAMKFGFEMALKDMDHRAECLLFPSEFTEGNRSILINGLVWMGDKQFMVSQVDEKIKAGFTCIKMKIGAINFNEELGILKTIRAQFSPDHIEFRVDANGAFKPEDALYKLNQLSKFHIHSIEQPIKQGQWKIMAELCKTSPIPIALDEELIAIRDNAKRLEMLKLIKPDYIILKPSLLGGFKDTDQWISIAESLGIKWWITSALESDIGLNAIAQYTFVKNNTLPQGLGTGKLYINNIPSPLIIKDGALKISKQKQWDFSDLLS
jgi:o-succinylbenzoate synthase